MTNQEILEKAIQKAIDGGWKPGWMDRRPVVSWGAQYSTYDEYHEGENVTVLGYHAKSNPSMWSYPLRELIFNHDFAKALWGGENWKDLDVDERPYGTWDGGPEWMEFDGPVWQVHLQQMVIAEDPIEYLGENL